MKIKQPAIVEVDRRFSAPCEQVFDAWFDRETISQWMFGTRTRSEEIVSLLADPRVGGSFSYLVRRNGVELEHIGEYKEIERPWKLAFTWGIRDGEMSLVSVSFQMDQGGCRLTLHHEIHPDRMEGADQARKEWESMLDTLNNVLEEQAAEVPRD